MPKPNVRVKEYKEYTRVKKLIPSERTEKHKSIVNTIKRVVNANTETKELYFNSGLTALAFTKLGDCMPLFARGDVATDTYYTCQQGDGDNERIGDSVRLQYLKLNLRIVASSASPDIVRIIVFRWKPNFKYGDDFNTLTPLILYNAVNDDYQSSMSHYNNKKQNYQILRDRIFSLNTYNPIKCIKMRIPLKGVKCEFTGDGSTTPNSQMTNNICLLVMAEGTPSNSYVFSSVISYKDA